MSEQTPKVYSFKDVDSTIDVNCPLGDIALTRVEGPLHILGAGCFCNDAGLVQIEFTVEGTRVIALTGTPEFSTNLANMLLSTVTRGI